MKVRKLLNLLSFSLGRTIQLDYKFVKLVKNISFNQKIYFILTKYYFLFKHIFVKFETGTSSSRIFDGVLYYNSSFGTIAGYQSILCEHMTWVKKYFQSTDHLFVVDIGANVGYFTRGLKSSFPNLKVLAVEPSNLASRAFVKNLPTTKLVEASILENVENVETAQITLVNMGVGYRLEEKFLLEDFKNTAVNRLVSSLNYIEEPICTPQKIICVPLDLLFERLRLTEVKIDVLKIDVEGNELEVLRGMVNTIKNVNLAIIELNSENWTLTELEEFLNLLNINFELLEARNFELIQTLPFRNGDILIRLFSK